LSAPATGQQSVTALRYFDVILLVVAAPIMLLIGVPAVGYLIAAGAWIVLRAIGAGAERLATAAPDANRQIAIRMAFMLGRLFALALAVILARQSSRGDGLTALAVVVFAFTMYLALSAANRPRKR
jgi:hypothetical protein